MDNLKLKVLVREAKKKGAVRKLRADGYIPAVLYGNNTNMPISVRTNEFEHLVNSGGSHSIVYLGIEGDRKKNTVVIKSIQRNPKNGKVEHVDFLSINIDQEIDTVLPVNIIGQENSPGIRAGGIVQHGAREIHIRGIAKNLPDHIDVNISDMEIGNVFRVGDIAAPEGVEMTGNVEEMIVSIVQPAKLEEEVPVIGAEEPEEIGREEKAEEVSEEKKEGKSES